MDFDVVFFSSRKKKFCYEIEIISVILKFNGLITISITKCLFFFSLYTFPFDCNQVVDGEFIFSALVKFYGRFAISILVFSFLIITTFWSRIRSAWIEIKTHHHFVETWLRLKWRRQGNWDAFRHQVYVNCKHFKWMESNKVLYLLRRLFVISHRFMLS